MLTIVISSSMRPLWLQKPLEQLNNLPSGGLRRYHQFQETRYKSPVIIWNCHSTNFGWKYLESLQKKDVSQGSVLEETPTS